MASFPKLGGILKLGLLFLTFLSLNSKLSLAAENDEQTGPATPCDSGPLTQGGTPPAAGPNTIEFYTNLKREMTRGFPFQGDDGWRKGVNSATPFVRVQDFKPGQLESFLNGNPIQTRIGDVLIKNAANQVKDFYPEMKAAGNSMVAYKDMTGHQVLRDRYWTQNQNGVWQRRTDLGATMGQGEAGFPVSAWGPADSGYRQRLYDRDNTGLIVFNSNVSSKVMNGGPSVIETESILPLRILPRDVDKIIFADGRIFRPNNNNNKLQIEIEPHGGMGGGWKSQLAAQGGMMVIDLGAGYVARTYAESESPAIRAAANSYLQNQSYIANQVDIASGVKKADSYFEWWTAWIVSHTGNFLPGM